MAESHRPLPTRRERRRRRKHIASAWTVAGAVALATVFSAASIPAAYALAEATSPAQTASAATTTAPQRVREIVQDAKTALSDARTARTDAAALANDIATAALDLGTDTGTDLGDLNDLVDRLEAAALDSALPLGTMLLPPLTDETAQETVAVNARTADLRERLDAATARKAAEEAAAEAQRQAEEAAAALAAANTPEAAQATARRLAAATYGWGDGEFSCLQSLWQKESSWNHQAYNDSSGATGIPQALPGDKMASAGDDWQTSATTQIVWGLDYISRAYGSPCGAWAKSQSSGWY